MVSEKTAPADPLSQEKTTGQAETCNVIPPGTPLDPPKRVLIIKPSSLGDIVTAMGVLRGLRRSFPDVHIAWLIRDIYTSLIAEDDDVDEIITYTGKNLAGSGGLHQRQNTSRVCEEESAMGNLTGLLTFKAWPGAVILPNGQQRRFGLAFQMPASWLRDTTIIASTRPGLIRLTVTFSLPRHLGSIAAHRT